MCLAQSARLAFREIYIGIELRIAMTRKLLPPAPDASCGLIWPRSLRRFCVEPRSIILNIKYYLIEST